jgi:excinuclease ABC subunit B
MSEAMEKAIAETERRRNIQIAYNKAHNITPKTIIKAIPNSVTMKKLEDVIHSVTIDTAKNKPIKKQDKEQLIMELEAEMKEQAKMLNFEEAARLRDAIIELRGVKTNERK